VFSLLGDRCPSIFFRSNCFSLLFYDCTNNGVLLPFFCENFKQKNVTAIVTSMACLFLMKRFPTFVLALPYRQYRSSYIQKITMLATRFWNLTYTSWHFWSFCAGLHRNVSSIRDLDRLQIKISFCFSQRQHGLAQQACSQTVDTRYILKQLWKCCYWKKPCKSPHKEKRKNVENKICFLRKSLRLVLLSSFNNELQKN